MTKLLEKYKQLNFSSECKLAFDRLKHLISEAPVLQPPDWSHAFEIMCDASDYAVGVVLGQKLEGKPTVIHYASRNLDDSQKNYTTIEK